MKVSLRDLAADVALDRLKRRRRLRLATHGDGTFDEEAHVEAVASTVERSKQAIAQEMERRVEMRQTI